MNKSETIGCVNHDCDQCKTKRTWVGLTDEEVMEIAFNFDVPSLVIRTAEHKLKEKNNV